jgi:hypothetical protein
MEIKLFYRYSNLDQEKKFQLVMPLGSIFASWIWFYLGKYLKKEISLYPYEIDWVEDNKLIYCYNVNRLNAKQIALNIVKKINSYL